MRITNQVYTLEATMKPVDYQGTKCSTTAFAVIEPSHITLIDTGFPGYQKELLDEINKLGKHKLPLKQIFLTHTDLDHMGNARWIQDKTGCDVYVSRREEPYLTGKKERLKKKQEMINFFGLEVPKYKFYPDDGKIQEYTFIPTPGHCEGHVCVLYRNVLFCGDALLFQNGTLTPANPLWSEDMEQAKASAEKLAHYKFSIICPAHGTSTKRKDYI